jgi:hypothetical protein
MRAKEFITEGGNVFTGRTSSIKREDIAPTLTNYFNELKQIFPRKADIFNTKHFHALGSVGKKDISGDIDLGIDVSSLVDKEVSDASIAAWGLDPAAVKAEAEALGKRARTATPEQLIMKAFLKLLTLYINAHAKNLYCDEKKVTNGNIFGLYPQSDAQGNDLGTGVQIDWMIGDLQWLNFSYYSSSYPKGSNVKGLHRTQLMLATFQRANYSFNHVGGVKDKATGETIATNPKDALALLSNYFNVQFTQEVTEDYYKLHALLKTLPTEDYNAILDIYLKILDSTRCDIPDDLQKYWVANQQRIGLKGKFLPAESALIQYQTEVA